MMQQGQMQPGMQPQAKPMGGQPPAAGQAPQGAAKHADMYKALVIDGMRAMYGEKTRAAFLKSIEQSGDKAKGVAGEVAGIIRLLDEKAGMKLPKQVLIPVGVALIVDALDFLERSGKIEGAAEMAQPAVSAFIAIMAAEYKALDAKRGAQQPPGGPPQAQPQPPQPAPQQQQPMGLIGAM